MGSLCQKCFGLSCFRSLSTNKQCAQTAVESCSEIIKEDAHEIVQNQLQFIHQIHKPMIIYNNLQHKLNSIISKLQNIKQTEDYYNQRQSGYFLEVLNIIYQELQRHEKVYQIAFDYSQVKQLIKIIENAEISNDIAKRIISEFLTRMSQCKNKLKILKPSSMINFSHFYNILRSDIETFNSGLLKIANYLDKDPNTRNKEYSHSYLDLNFDLKNQEVIEILKIVNTMYDVQPLSFGFFAHYLYLSCLKLQEKGMTIQSISREIKRCVNFLHTNFSFMKISDKEVEHDCISEIHMWPQEAIQYNTIDLTQIENSYVRQAYIEQFFLQRVKEVEEFIPLFTLFTQEISRSCKGYGYKCKLRIQDKSQQQVIDEIKEQVLSYILTPVKLDMPINIPFQDINTITFKEISNYHSSIRELIAAVNKPIFIKQGMLLTTVLFDKSAEVYEASRKIIQRVKFEKKIKFVQLQNQMRTKNKGYLSLRFLFNDKYIAQLRLVRVSLPDNSKRDGLKQIERHNFYYMAQQIWRLYLGTNCSLFGRTRMLSQKYEQFFLRITSYILNNAKRQKNKQSPHKFTQLSYYLQELFQKCKLSVNIYERHYSETNSISLIKYFKQLRDLLNKAPGQNPQAKRRQT